MADQFQPKFKFGIDVPLAVGRRCPKCGRDTVAVNVTGNFSYRCYNAACLGRHHIEYVSCFLQLRDFELAMMRLTLGDYIKLKFDEKTGKAQPDFDHKVYDAVMTRGPYQDCTGTLQYSDAQMNRFNWVTCNVCNAQYRIAIFAEYGLSGERLLHDCYRWFIDERHIKRVVTEWKPSAILSPPNQKIALWIDTVKIHNRELRGEVLKGNQ